MSRFLDAMRDSGEQGRSDKKDRSYDGLIVDVEHVLGRDNTESAQSTNRDDNHTDEPSTSADAVDDNHQQGNNRADEAPLLSLRDEALLSKSVADADSNPSAQHADAEASATADDTPLPQQSGRDQEVSAPPRVLAVRNLDPLFYLIVGVAALGLFGSLYALITQNDAYFEREYQQLQKESAALQARLAATASLAVANDATSDAANDAAGDISDADRQVIIASNNSLLASAAESPVPQVSKQQAPVVAQPQADAVLPTASATSSGDATAAHEVASGTDRVTPVVAATEPADNKSSDSAALTAIRQEVDELRSLLAMQERKIVRLEQDKMALSRQLENHSQHAHTAAPLIDKTTPAEAATRSVAASSEMPMEPPVTRSILSLDKPLSNTDSDISSIVGRAYLAYQAQDYVTAGALYDEALQFDPYHRDANLGVAAVAQTNSDFKLAEHRYRHLLTLDPSDSVAFSALLNLASRSNSRRIIEAELSQHVQYVNNPHQLYSILGNYYSQQQRWLEAGQAYAVAIAGDQSNADYLFNYAVTLDNLGRVDQAADHYSRALATARNSVHSFDVSAVELRLKTLTVMK